jgi:uncharacterized protein (TIGR02145 family)
MTYLKKHEMKIRILLLTMLPVICLAQVNSNGEKPSGELLSKEISPNEMKRNASFNVEEIKVRWKKAALENCTGVPCVAAPSFTCGTSTISDIDGNVYETVSIGTQCWTKTNLKVTKYNNGDEIPDSTNSTWGTATIGARTGHLGTDYNINPVPNYIGTYGYLYNWYAVTDSRKMCPAGWHVPSFSEWKILAKYIDPVADTTQNCELGCTIINTVAGSLKSTALWSTSGASIDIWGFSALPAANRRDNSHPNAEIGILSNFWTTNETIYPGAAIYTQLSTLNGDLVANIGNLPFNNKISGLSVRCLKD